MVAGVLLRWWQRAALAWSGRTRAATGVVTVCGGGTRGGSGGAGRQVAELVERVNQSERQIGRIRRPRVSRRRIAHTKPGRKRRDRSLREHQDCKPAYSRGRGGDAAAGAGPGRDHRVPANRVPGRGATCPTRRWRVDHQPLLRPVPPGQTPVSIRQPRQRSLPAPIRLDEHRSAAIPLAE